MASHVKTLLWLDDHLNRRDEAILLGAYLKLFDDMKVQILRAASIEDFAGHLRNNASHPSQISGVVIDQMLTHPYGCSNWQAIGFPDIEIAPFVAGAQLLEIMLLQQYETQRPDYLKAFTGHSKAILTVAREPEVALRRIPKQQRESICVIYKREGEDPELADLRTWLSSL